MGEGRVSKLEGSFVLKAAKSVGRKGSSFRPELCRAPGPIELLEGRRLLAWQLDPAFGQLGTLSDTLGLTPDTDHQIAFRDIAVQTDKKLLALGQIKEGDAYRA